MVIQYKCPTCGSDLTYDIEKDSMLCPHCNYSIPVSQMSPVDVPEGEEEDVQEESSFDGSQLKNEAEFHYIDDDTHVEQTYNEDAAEFFCQNCGAVIVSDANTAATWCHYCDSPVVLKERLTGQLAPTYVIPFRVTKEQAQKAFEEWSKKGLFTPRKFRDAKKVKSVQGIYIPFWLYDISSEGTAEATATKVRTYISGDYIYTETRHFNIYRRAKLNYIHIPADASEKMNDTIMNLLEPFRYNELQTFQMPFLAGFSADKYSYTADQMYERAKTRAEGFARQYVRESIHGYSSVNYRNETVVCDQKHADYTMLPVWIFSYDYEDTEHMFAMNGQTGKIVGTLPIDKKRVFGFWSLFAGGAFALMTAAKLIYAIVTYLN